MRLTVHSHDANQRHTGGITTVHASLGGDILTGGDDGAVWRWSAGGEPLQKVCDAVDGSGVTVVQWMPGSGRKKGAEAARDSIVVACSNGSLMYVTAQSSRVEKVVAAHTGAITGIAWAPDGGTMVTSGEDGTVRAWSHSGIQRSTVASMGRCVYCLVWGVDSAETGGECVLFAVGSDVVIKPQNPSVKRTTQWKAHHGTVLCADWSRMSNLIVTGGEDGYYKVWDPYGRNVFSVSAASEHPITSVAFAPNGESFAVGSFRSVRVCDRTGWTHCREACKGGSVLALSWTGDSTQIITGGGSGAMGIAQLVDRKTHWRNLICTHSDEKKLHIEDVLNDTHEELEHRDKVIKVAMGFGYLVVATATQCVVYDTSRWGNPVQLDLRDFVVSVQQTERAFAVADCVQGIQVFTYEGRLLSTIKPSATLRPEALSSSLVSLSSDTVAVRDPTDPRKVLFFDPGNGKPVREGPLVHHAEIAELALSQFGPLQDRKVAFIDRNRDLYIATVHTRYAAPVKIATMVSSAAWNDLTEGLVAITDGQLVTWYYPSVVFVDRDLLQLTREVRASGDEFGRNDSIVSFAGASASVRRGSDGALLSFGVSPFPRLLYGHLARGDWDGATKLCRYLKEPALWGVLAALAVKGGELHTAEVAYAALGDVDKLRYFATVKEVPTAEGRQAEMALFQRRPDEAERVLLQAGLVFRAIEMHMTLHKWDRALEIAVERRTHVDTVVAFRQRYLETVGRKETLDKFKQVAPTVQIDWPTLEEKIKQEHEKERQRGKPYQSPTASTSMKK
jgi:intraflagellar transport protein 80